MPDWPPPAVTVRRRVMLLLFTGLLPLLLAGYHHSAPAQENGTAVSWCAASGQSDIPAGECQALEVLYNSTNGRGWTDSSGWLSSTAVCSEWSGVTCGNGHVTDVVLVANNLSGPLPDAIGDLATLTRLDLTGNELSGEIPTAIASLSALSDLSLGGNRLEGAIPAEIGGLSALVALDLGDNRLSGEIPAALGTLPELAEMLYLDGNMLEGPIPASLCGRTFALASVNYNQLDYFATDEACEETFPGWQNTQTTGPAGVSVEVLDVASQRGETAVSGEILVRWLPISFAGTGGYEVFTRDLAGGAVESRARIVDKTVDSVQFTVEDNPNAYSYFVRAWSDAHENNQSALSGDSDEVRVGAMPLRLPPRLSDDALLILPALALPALLLLTLLATAAFRRRSVNGGQ